MHLITRTTLLLTFLAVLAGCGGGDDAAREAETAAHEAAEAAEAESQAAEGLMDEALSAARGALTGDPDAEPVAYETLQALLPDGLDGLRRTDLRGERDGAMGFFVSTAEAHYEGADGTIEIAIVDLGGITNPSMFGFGWTETDTHREWSGGYERTVTFDGHRAHEQYDRDAGTGQMAVIVADRFVVAVDGTGVPMTAIKDALSRLDLKRLASLE